MVNSSNQLLKSFCRPQLIGRNVGQLFKKEVFIMDLPTMSAPSKEKPRAAVDTPEGAGLDKLFQAPAT